MNTSGQQNVIETDSSREITPKIHDHWQERVCVFKGGGGGSVVYGHFREDAIVNKNNDKMNKIKNRQTPNVPDWSFLGRQGAVATGSVLIKNKTCLFIYFIKEVRFQSELFVLGRGGIRCWQDFGIRAGLSQQNVGRVHSNPQAAKQSQRAVYFLQSKQLTLMFRCFIPKR